MAIACGATLGTAIFGLATFYVYFIGVYVGFPLGIAMGAISGFRNSTKDIAFVFVVMSTTMQITHWIFGWKGDSVLFDGILTPILTGALAVLAACCFARKLPPSVKFWIGAPGTIVLLSSGFLSFVMAIYRT